MRKLFVICLFALSLLSLYSGSVSYIRPSVPMEEKKENKEENTGYVRPATPMEKKEEKSVEATGYIRPATPIEKEEEEAEESTGYVRLVSEEKTEKEGGNRMEAALSSQSEPDFAAVPEKNSYSTPLAEEVKTETAEDYRPYIFVAGEHTFSGYTDYGYISIYLDDFILENLSSFISYEREKQNRQLDTAVVIGEYEIEIYFDSSINGKYLIPLLEDEIEEWLNPVEAAEAETEETAETPEAAVVEEEKEARFVTFLDFDYFGIESHVEVYSTYTTLTIPEGVTDDDIITVRDIISSAFPEETALVTYSPDDGILTLSYPDQTDKFLISALGDMESLAKRYLRSLAESFIAEREKEAETAAEEKTVAAGTFSYRGIESEVKVYNTYATLTVPEVVTIDDIIWTANIINATFPKESALVTYTLDGNTLTLTYPEQTDELLLALMPSLKNWAEYLIDELIEDSIKAESEKKTSTITKSETSDSASSASAKTSGTSSQKETAQVAPAETPVKEKADSLWKLSFRLNSGLNVVFGKNDKMGGVLFIGASAEYTYDNIFALYGSLTATFPSPFFIAADVGLKAERQITSSLPLNLGASVGLAFVPVLDSKVTLYGGAILSYKFSAFDVNLEYRYGLGGYTYIGLYGSYRF